MIDRSKFIAALDVSTVVWDKDDYEANQHEFLTVLEMFPTLLKNLEKFPIMLNDDQLEQILSEFPYSDLQGNLWAVGHTILSFFTTIGGRAKSYSKKDLAGIASEPQQVKCFFNDDLKQEVNYSISFYHENQDENRAYFSFRYFWNGTNVLKTKVDKFELNHIAVVAEQESDIDDFFSQFNLVFENIPKHDISAYKDRVAWLNSDNKDEFISQLTCLKNNSAQELLDSRYDVPFGNDRYYSYDVENDVYVVFRRTENNKFHGHDEYNIDKVPTDVKKHFQIEKYSQ